MHGDGELISCVVPPQPPPLQAAVIAEQSWYTSAVYDVCTVVPRGQLPESVADDLVSALRRALLSPTGMARRPDAVKAGLVMAKLEKRAFLTHQVVAAAFVRAFADLANAVAAGATASGGSTGTARCPAVRVPTSGPPATLNVLCRVAHDLCAAKRRGPQFGNAVLRALSQCIATPTKWNLPSRDGLCFVLQAGVSVCKRLQNVGAARMLCWQTALRHGRQHGLCVLLASAAVTWPLVLNCGREVEGVGSMSGAYLRAVAVLTAHSCSFQASEGATSSHPRGIHSGSPAGASAAVVCPNLQVLRSSCGWDRFTASMTHPDASPPKSVSEDPPAGELTRLLAARRACIEQVRGGDGASAEQFASAGRAIQLLCAHQGWAWTSAMVVRNHAVPNHVDKPGKEAAGVGAMTLLHAVAEVVHLCFRSDDGAVAELRGVLDSAATTLAEASSTPLSVQLVAAGMLSEATAWGLASDQASEAAAKWTKLTSRSDGEAAWLLLRASTSTTLCKRE